MVVPKGEALARATSTLKVAGRFGKAIDHRLIDHDPIARAERFADGAFHGIDIGKDTHRFYPPAPIGRSVWRHCRPPLRDRPEER